MQKSLIKKTLPNFFCIEHWKRLTACLTWSQLLFRRLTLNTVKKLDESSWGIVIYLRGASPCRQKTPNRGLFWRSQKFRNKTRENKQLHFIGARLWLQKFETLLGQNYFTICFHFTMWWDSSCDTIRSWNFWWMRIEKLFLHRNRKKLERITIKLKWKYAK